jgi:2-dehydropantoate 2-reductase
MATKGGPELMAEFLAETSALATEAECPPSPDYLKSVKGLLFDRESSFTASMLRDMEAGGPIEADHVIGDMYRRARDAGLDAHLLRVAFCNLQAYEVRRTKKTQG